MIFSLVVGFVLIVVLLIFLLPVSGNIRSSQFTTAVKQSGPFIFPEGFFWGSGISDHQVSTRQNSDWADFERYVMTHENFEGLADGQSSPGNILGYGKYSLSAHRNKSNFSLRYREDLSAAHEMGQNIFRLSISWSRLFSDPKQKKPSISAIAYYRSIISYLKRKNIKPLITLFHFDSPSWFWQEHDGKVGWERADALEHWQKFVRVVVDKFGADVQYWCTLHEPMLYAINGYLEGIFPPLIQRESPEGIVPVISKLLKAHALAYEIIKKDSIQRGKESFIGFSVHARSFQPLRNYSFFDRVSAENIEQFFVWDVIDATQTGYLKIDYLDYYEEIPGLENTLDYIGIDYFGRVLVKSKITAPTQANFVNDQKNQQEERINPHGFYKILKEAHKKYKLPIFILEDGIDDKDLNDEKRKNFMDLHIKEIWNALQDGVDIRCYIYWSLIDGFEWSQGFEPRYGLIAVNYNKSYKRTARKSSQFYQQIISRNALPPSS